MTDNKVPGKFSAIINQKCPRCRKGDIFVHPTLSTGFLKMHENCPVCNLHYEIEPGFFWGAMYISYGFTVAIAIIVAVLIYKFLDDPDVIVYLGILLAVLLVLSPMIFRYSRIMMLYLFSSVKYDPKAAEKHWDN